MANKMFLEKKPSNFFPKNILFIFAPIKKESTYSGTRHSAVGKIENLKINK